MTKPQPAFLLLLGVLAAACLAQEKPNLPPVAKDSGFAWIDGDDSIPHVVERSAIEKGIPREGHPRDVIPPIDEPQWYATHAEAIAEFDISDDDRVLGIAFDGDARAYPTRILDRHEIVNDTVGGRHLAVVW